MAEKNTSSDIQREAVVIRDAEIFQMNLPDLRPDIPRPEHRLLRSVWRHRCPELTGRFALVIATGHILGNVNPTANRVLEEILGEAMEEA